MGWINGAIRARANAQQQTAVAAYALDEVCNKVIDERSFIAPPSQDQPPFGDAEQVQDTCPRLLAS